MKPTALLAITLAMISCSGGPGEFTPTTRVERQMVGLVQKFDRWDYNGDGQLSAKELAEPSKISGHTPAQIIAFYDTNKDGKISLKEAQAGYQRAEEAEMRVKKAR